MFSFVTEITTIHYVTLSIEILCCDAVRYFSIIPQPHNINSCSVSSMNPNPPTPASPAFVIDSCSLPVLA